MYLNIYCLNRFCSNLACKGDFFETLGEFKVVQIEVFPDLPIWQGHLELIDKEIILWV